MIRKLSYLILLLLICNACFNLNKLSLYDLSNQYTGTLFTSHNTAAVNDGDNVTVYVPIKMVDFISKMDDSTGRSYVKIRVSTQLFSSYESKDVIDSSSVLFIDSTMSFLDTSLRLNIAYPSEGLFILKTSIVDLNRIDDVNSYLFLRNAGDGSRNDFLLSSADGEILYRNYVAEEDDLSLSFQGDEDKLIVRHYKRDFPLALPPFIEDSDNSFNIKPDSVFILELRDGRTENLHLVEEGFYHVQIDTNNQRGFTIFRFPEGFPNVSTPEQMLGPMRYITTKKEYEEIQQSSDLKLAIDNYWLQNAGNPTRARSMIQKYYGRVAEANNYFSSYHEGWKTDRGLIFIIYGPPRVVYRGDGIEEWLYGEKGNSNSMRFRFVKIDNPYTENDYNLIKSPSYKEKWYNIVNTWRR